MAVRHEEGLARRLQTIEAVPLEDALARADFVSLHVSLTRPGESAEPTYHLMDERRLRLMKPTAILVNTARGAVVDEAALARALREGWIGGAALDVFEREPLPADSPLRDGALDAEAAGLPPLRLRRPGHAPFARSRRRHGGAGRAGGHRHAGGSLRRRPQGHAVRGQQGGVLIPRAAAPRRARSRRSRLRSPGRRPASCRRSPRRRARRRLPRVGRSGPAFRRRPGPTRCPRVARRPRWTCRRRGPQACAWRSRGRSCVADGPGGCRGLSRCGARGAGGRAGPLPPGRSAPPPGGDPRAAIEELQVSLRLDPQSARAYGTLGVALHGRGEHPEAAAAFAEAERLDPAYFTNRPAERAMSEASRRGARGRGAAISLRAGGVVIVTPEARCSSRNSTPILNPLV